MYYYVTIIYANLNLSKLYTFISDLTLYTLHNKLIPT